MTAHWAGRVIMPADAERKKRTCAVTGNSVLDADAGARPGPLQPSRSPAAETGCTSCRPAPATKSRRTPPIAGTGASGASTPFSVLQHTLWPAPGRLQYERHERAVGPGETMLVVIPHQHRYWIEDGERWEFFWLAMTGHEALRLHRAILAAAGPGVPAAAGDGRAARGDQSRPS